MFVFKTCGQQILSLPVRHVLHKGCFLQLFLCTTLFSNIFLLPSRSPRFLLRPCAMIGSCSNAVLRFEFICNKCQCLLIICFTSGNVLLYVKTKGILFRSFCLDFGASDAFVSIFGSR